MKQQYIRRYTDIAALVYMLTNRKITLLDPRSWDDSNDSYFLRIYRDRKHLESVLALCFIQSPEKYHHWKVFASGPSGVRIKFRYSELLALIRKTTHIRAEEVRYLTLKQAQSRKIKTEELPFLKRYPFADEREFRIIYESKNKSERRLDISISLSCIDEITLSPWLPTSLFGDIKKLLKTISGCQQLKVVHSTLIGNDEWKNLAES